jgi:hypothetical protein
VYVVDASVRAVCQVCSGCARCAVCLACDTCGQYGRKSDAPGPEALLRSTVDDAVSILAGSSESLAGCAVDFAVLKSGDTCLVEVNDGVFTGQYDGVTDDDFCAMYVARWRELLQRRAD